MAENRIILPDDAELAKVVIAAQQKEIGLIGKIVGSKEHAPTNIIALVVLALLVLLAIVLLAPIAEDIPRGALVTALLSAVTFALGLIFGRSSA